MPVNPTSFRRFDQSTADQWAAIMADPANAPGSQADLTLRRLRQLSESAAGFAVDELTHSLQTASRAEHAGAPDDVVLGALLHDIGHLFVDDNHGGVAAELLRPHAGADIVEVVRFHTDFTSRHYARIFDRDPDRREQHRGERWFGLAEQFADEWDQLSFDPGYPTPAVEHFEPLVRALIIDS